MVHFYFTFFDIKNDICGKNVLPILYAVTNFNIKLHCHQSKLMCFFHIGCSRLGVYGNNCDQPCSERCPESRCDITNGACLSCPTGWTGDTCDKSKDHSKCCKFRNNFRFVYAHITFFQCIKSLLRRMSTWIIRYKLRGKM